MSRGSSLYYNRVFFTYLRLPITEPQHPVCSDEHIYRATSGRPTISMGGVGCEWVTREVCKLGCMRSESITWGSRGFGVLIWDRSADQAAWCGREFVPSFWSCVFVTPSSLIIGRFDWWWVCADVCVVGIKQLRLDYVSSILEICSTRVCLAAVQDGVSRHILEMNNFILSRQILSWSTKYDTLCYALWSFFWFTKCSYC